MGENVSFGEYLRGLREEKKFTQTFIADAAEISEKTLRRIELDKATPRIETLEKLSLIFNEDLMLNFIKYSAKGMELYEKTKQELERKIKQHNFKDLLKDIARLEQLIQDVDSPYYMLQFQQYTLLIKGILTYQKEKNYRESIKVFTEGIHTSNKNFSIIHYKDFSYSSMELRLLMNIGFAFNKLGNSLKYVEILSFIMEETNEDDPVYPSVVHNLATACKRAEKYSDAIDLAVKGIDYCKKNADYSLLPILYYGKGVSEFHLNRESYKVSFKKAMSTAELIGLDDLRSSLAERCIEHFQYDVSMDVDGFFEDILNR